MNYKESYQILKNSKSYYNNHVVEAFRVFWGDICNFLYIEKVSGLEPEGKEKIFLEKQVSDVGSDYTLSMKDEDSGFNSDILIKDLMSLGDAYHLYGNHSSVVFYISKDRYKYLISNIKHYYKEYEELKDEVTDYHNDTGCL